MLTSAYPKTHLIKGISPQLLNGSENTILRPPFFIEVDGKLHWTPDSRWKLDDLREVKNGDESFILYFDESDYIGINVNEILHLMGSEFHQTISKLIKDGVIDFSLSAWKPTIHGYHAAVMTHVAFLAFRESLASELLPLIEDYLANEFSEHSDISDIFKAYDHLMIQEEFDKKELALLSGAFFRTLGDEDSYKFVSWDVLNHDALFDTQHDYDKAVEKYIRALKAVHGQI